MDKLEALLIGGYWPEVMAVTFGVLTRAGFTVDVISNNAAFKRTSKMRDYVLAKKRDLLVRTAAEKIKKEYSLVVVGDDATLGVILNSDLSQEQKLRLLPVLSEKKLRPYFFENRLIARPGRKRDQHAGVPDRTQRGRIGYSGTIPRLSNSGQARFVRGWHGYI